MIPLNGLELRVDDESKYGLAFNRTDHTQKIPASILNHGSGYFSIEDIDEKIGLPTKVGEGNRYLYTRSDKSGLSRLCLDDGLVAIAGDDGLAVSGDVGRVVVVNGAEGAQKNYVSYARQLQLEADRQKAEIDKRFHEAMAILKK